MKRFALVLAITGLLGGAALAGEVDLNLQAAMAGASSDQMVSVLVYLNDRVDLRALNGRLDAAGPTLAQRHETVVTTLRQQAEQAQPDLIAALEELTDEGSVSFYQRFWIANCVRVDATPAVIKELGQRADVAAVYLNYEIELIEPVAVGEPEAASEFSTRGTPEDGVVAVRAPEVWALGFTGEGVLTSTLDTGVDGSHPALAARWRGVADSRYANNPEWAWFDPRDEHHVPGRVRLTRHAHHGYGLRRFARRVGRCRARRPVDSRGDHRSRRHSHHRGRFDRGV